MASQLTGQNIHSQENHYNKHRDEYDAITAAAAAARYGGSNMHDGPVLILCCLFMFIQNFYSSPTIISLRAHFAIAGLTLMRTSRAMARSKNFSLNANINAEVRTDWSSFDCRPLYRPPTPSFLMMFLNTWKEDVVDCPVALLAFSLETCILDLTTMYGYVRPVAHSLETRCQIC